MKMPAQETFASGTLRLARRVALPLAFPLLSLVAAPAAFALADAGKLDVTFFEDIQVHLHTGAKTNDTAAAFHLMGGWPDHGFGGADHNFFTEAVADPGNIGFPQPVGVDDYRAGKGEPETYRPRARQVFAGVLPMDYPLEWTAGTKEFKSTEPKENNLLIIRTEHQVKRLTPRRVSSRFARTPRSPVASMRSMRASATTRCGSSRNTG